MEKVKSLEETREEFLNVRKSLSPQQLDEAIGFPTKKDRILSLFTIRYKPYIKLINEGIIVFSYVYKTQFNINKNSNYFKSWILFSPAVKYEENPVEYSKIAAKLEDFLQNPPKKYKSLAKRINNIDNDFKLVELPREVFEDQMFLSTNYTKEKVNPNLMPGINLSLLNRKVSKNIILLPEVFYHQR